MAIGAVRLAARLGIVPSHALEAIHSARPARPASTPVWLATAANPQAARQKKITPDRGAMYDAAPRPAA
jgi:hypothetical protein